MYGYINNENVNHAKIYQAGVKLGSWLVSISGLEFMFRSLRRNKGYLICNGGNKVEDYNLALLGRRQSCGLNDDNQIIWDCY